MRPAIAANPRAAADGSIETDTPVWAIAPGQACVLYDGDRCLGGGRIASPVAGRGARDHRAGRRRVDRMTIGPALPLALLVGLVNTAIYVLIRGDAGGRLPVTYVAAALGAWAGAAIGGRIGFDILTIGDFPLIPATILAWVGIGIVAVLATPRPAVPEASADAGRRPAPGDRLASSTARGRWARSPTCPSCWAATRIARAASSAASSSVPWSARRSPAASMLRRRRGNGPG